jgi:calcium-dependent protein kinase
LAPLAQKNVIQLIFGTTSKMGVGCSSISAVRVQLQDQSAPSEQQDQTRRTANDRLGSIDANDANFEPLPASIHSKRNLANGDRRESEKKGLRVGLVHSRPGHSVFEYYEKISAVGHGMTGAVYNVRNKNTGEHFALKAMEKSRIDAELLADLRNEIEVLRMMDHPHVVKLVEYFEDKDNLFLILELAEGGELFDRLHEQTNSHYSESEAARLVFKFCAAISYIHLKGVTHRDLKLENFVFETKDSDSNVKLIDFGLSSKYGSGIRRMTTMVGTPYYIAPEVLDSTIGEGKATSRSGDEHSYTNACDNWSLGVITYMLLSGSPPFKGKRDRDVLHAVKKGKFSLSGPRWENISSEAKDFVRRLLVYNPSKRMTAEDALNHPWLYRAKSDTESAPLDPEIILSLRDFSKLSAFKRAAMEAIAFSTSTHSTAHYMEAFNKVDKGHSGFVNRLDFVEVMQSSGMSIEEAEQIFSSMAHASSGQLGLFTVPNDALISYTEFLAATLPKRFWLQRDRVRDAFSRLDLDNDNFITPDNLKQVMGDDWTPQLYHQLFMEIGMTVGADHPGKVSVDELTDWFLSGEEGIQSLSTSSSSNSLSNVHSSANLSELEGVLEAQQQQQQQQQKQPQQQQQYQDQSEVSEHTLETSDTIGLLVPSHNIDLIGSVPSRQV